jgi:uncharacterized repeat protein (TIGR03803 family)
MKQLNKLVGACLSALLAACGGGNVSTPAPMAVAPQTAARQSTGFMSSSNGYVSLYSFKGGSKDGVSPVAGLIAVNGELYGTTEYGGSKGVSGSCGSRGCGTVFEINSSGKESALYYFEGPAAGDGANPVAALTDVNGTLYGTTEYGTACISGSCGSGSGCAYESGYGQPCGTVFAVSTSGKETVLYSFKDSPDGANPAARLIAVHGVLYGTTKAGGAGYSGTVFEINSSGGEKVLYSFGILPDGWYPNASLTDVSGMLYGTTPTGGKCSPSGYCLGTVFDVSMSGTEHLLHYFTDGIKDGAYPEAGVIAVNGTLYGTTSGGGIGSCSGVPPGCGTVFEMTTSGKEKLLYRFKGGKDGAYPLAGLADVDGVLYGTTYLGGGGCGCGTIFKVSTSGQEKILHAFKGGTDGAEPSARLSYVNGVLYGTTTFGGTHNDGTVFRISP